MSMFGLAIHIKSVQKILIYPSVSIINIYYQINFETDIQVEALLSFRKQIFNLLFKKFRFSVFIWCMYSLMKKKKRRIFCTNLVISARRRYPFSFFFLRTQFLWDERRSNGVIASISNIIAICRGEQSAGPGHQQGRHQSDGWAGEAVSENQDRRHGVCFSQSHRVLWPE